MGVAALAGGLAAAAIALAVWLPGAEPDHPAARDRMVAEQIEARGVKDRRVLRALREVPREAFVPPELRSRAHGDHPLPIGEDQTISQPYIVALMTELAEIATSSRVLEIGTGSGYQAAVLAVLADEVYTIEILEGLATSAAERLARLGYRNVEVRHGDGYRGWPEAAPFDAIIVTAAPAEIPRPLLDQLADGGRLVIPVGDEYQELVVVRREGRELHRTSVIPVRFVPMTGEVQRTPATTRPGERDR